MNSKDPQLRKKRHHPAFRVAFGLAYLADLALAARINPRETLLVSGFWRSGTTWIQNSIAEILNAKIVFEPFQYNVPEMHRVLQEMGVLAEHPHPNMFMPGTFGTHSPLAGIVRKAVRGALRGRWVRLYRLHWRDAFRRRVIVKFTRAALSLECVQQVEGSSVLHITRDPRAVVASVVYKTGSMGGKFSPAFSLEQDLLEVQDGRADYFKTWQRDIRSFDNRPFSIKIAAYWSLTERRLADAYARLNPARSCTVQYEDLAADPEHEVPRLLQALGYAQPDKTALSILHKDSLTSVRKLGQDVNQMIHGWRSIVPESEAAEIVAIAHDFGLEDRLRDG